MLELTGESAEYGSPRRLDGNDTKVIGHYSFLGESRLSAGANQPPLTLRSGAFALPPNGPIIPVVNQRSRYVFLVNFRRWCMGAQFWDPGAPQQDPSKTIHTYTHAHAHNGEVRPSSSEHVRDEVFSP